jgi:bifunctional non-homologous end joining protein LigD
MARSSTLSLRAGSGLPGTRRAPGGARHGAPLESVEPMLATLAADLPQDLDNYGFEYKWDGVRALCYWDGRRLRFESRNRLEITHRYPELHVLGEALGSRPAVLDGEIVALDEAGRPSFPLLQNRMHVNSRRDIERLTHEIPVRYLVFDLLHLDGRSVMDRSYVHRRDMLEQLTLIGPSWEVPPSHVGDGPAMLAAAREQGLEGVMAKRLTSLYHPGRRSPEWLKIKVIARQEFVIGGWVPGDAGTNPSRIGSLLVGYYEPACAGSAPSGRRGPVLRFAGGVGTGYNDAWHRALTAKLKPLTRATSPFADPVPKPDKIFVEPLLVAEIEYRRWPAGGVLHQAAFKGLRTDKSPRKVVREDRMCEPAPRPANRATSEVQS